MNRQQGTHCGSFLDVLQLSRREISSYGWMLSLCARANLRLRKNQVVINSKSLLVFTKIVTNRFRFQIMPDMTLRCSAMVCLLIFFKTLFHLSITRSSYAIDHNVLSNFFLYSSKQLRSLRQFIAVQGCHQHTIIYQWDCLIN